MTPYTLHLGDNLATLRAMPGSSVDSIVTDPPYGLSFMGKKWDYDVPSVELWQECLRVLKPGGHLLAFAGTRTQHRMAVRIEDAGFEIRDMIAWVYGSGFPKSLDVSKAIDKAAGVDREVVGPNPWADRGGLVRANTYGEPTRPPETSPATDAARQWQGWGTALKPALEPITVARKPLEGTVAENVLEHGTGAINVDGCRVGNETVKICNYKSTGAQGCITHTGVAGHSGREYEERSSQGRWPANLIHDGSEEVLAAFPQTAPSPKVPVRQGGQKSSGGIMNATGGDREGYGVGYGDTGSAARFFKCCPSDRVCPLCNLTHAKACNNIQVWKSILVSSAEKRGWTSQATSEFIARVNAIGPASERIVQNVKSAGNLCDSCAISIAVALVAIKTSDFSNEELQAILDYTGNCNNSILTQNLACFAELWANIDIIPTTKSLSLLFGSVQDVTGNFTRQDTKAGEELKCEPSRFAYVPKASKRDRDEGNFHATVKPTNLMRYLCRLVTPPGGVVLDPFMGSGSTGKAAMLEGFRFIGCELSEEYFKIADARISAALASQPLL